MLKKKSGLITFLIILLIGMMDVDLYLVEGKTSTLNEHESIKINSDLELADYFGGNIKKGTSLENAYIFEFLNISGGSEPLIEISYTTKFIIIRNCYFEQESYTIGVSIISNSMNILFENCIFMNSGKIEVEACSNINFINCYFYEYSIESTYNENCKFLNNTFEAGTEATYDPIQLPYCSKITIQFNNFNGSSYNIYSLHRVNQADISYNRFISGTGIFGRFGNSSIYGNVFINKTGSGIRLEEIDASNNLIWNNSFFTSIAGFYYINDDGTNNTFSKNGWGNYYDDYEEAHPTAENNGIAWDEPFIFPFTTGQDDYPLVNPFPIDDYKFEYTPTDANDSIPGTPIWLLFQVIGLAIIAIYCKNSIKMKEIS